MSDSTYGSSVPNADDTTAVSPAPALTVEEVESKLAKALDEVSSLKYSLDSMTRRYDRESSRYERIHSKLVELLDTIQDADSSTLTVDTDTLGQLCGEADVDFSKNVTYSVVIRGTIEVQIPIWEDADNVSRHDLNAEVTCDEDGIVVEDFCLSVDSLTEQ